MAWDWLKRRKPAEPPKPRRRKFLAADINRINSQFTSQNSSIDFDVYSQGEVLIARARYLAINNEYARRYLSIVGNNVIGPTGIKFQSKITRGGSKFEKGRKAVEAAWKVWGKKGNCDLSRRLSWHDIERMTLQFVKRDGEAFIYLSQGRDFRVQFIDPLHIPIKLNEKLKNGNHIVMGIELTPQRQPVAYYISSSKQELNPSIYRFGQDKYERIPAERMLHVTHPDFADQTRGYTHMAAAIQRMNMLQRFDEATMVAQRVAASKMAFIIDPEEGPAYEGEDSGNEYDPREDVEPGVIDHLAHGSTLASFDPSQPNTVYGEYTKWCLRAMASGLNISYHSLAQDMETVNFSSARVATLEDREMFKADQEWLVRELHDPLFDKWLMNKLLARQITVSGQPVGADRFDDFSARHWQGRRWSWVDPAKDVAAAKHGVALRTTSISRIIREAGDDPDEVFEEIAADQERLKELGIEVTIDAPRDTPDGAAVP